jgi:nucleoid DNA-binding protein
MNERAQIIKTAIMMELSKEGKTLQDIETELAKQAGMSLVDFGKFTELVKNIGGLGISSALVAGGTVGLGAYGAYRMNEDSNEKQLKKIKEQQQYLDATKSLQQNMQHPIQL